MVMVDEQQVNPKTLLIELDDWERWRIPPLWLEPSN